MFETIVYAANNAGNAGSQNASGNPNGMLILLVPMILIFYFMIIRPQKKKEKELKNMLAALKVGDEVATIGGIHGKIVRAKDDVFVIESGVGNNKSTITVDRGSVARFLKQAPENKEVKEIFIEETIEEATDTEE